MSKLNNFIAKYDKTIIMTIMAIIPTVIVSIGLLPMLIENYTFNAYINGERNDYIDFFQAFRSMQLFAIIFMVFIILYNYGRRSVDKDIVSKSSGYINVKNSSLALIFGIVSTCLIFFLNHQYEDKNIIFVHDKIVNIKKSIQDGKCYPARQRNDSTFNDPNIGDVSTCGTIEKKLPGTLRFMNAGDYTSTANKNGVVTSITEHQPNTINYKGYFGPFCRSLFDVDNIMFKEFDTIEIHGSNPLSGEYGKSSCETYKNIGQIQFMFKW